MNARGPRPRDALGRPLPWGAAGVEPVPDIPRTGEEAVAAASKLVAAGLPFAAHEVLEGRWKCCPDAERELWQGLAQLAVGLTHRARGNAPGAARLFARGAGHVEAYRATGGPTYGLDLPAIVAWAGRQSARSPSDRGTMGP